ncbi:MAG TPA: hypothetical protein VLZ30_03975 [Verrucomicrobiae bacterium]|nr:hypothetical protein [Verrucomicrobiae bacterium]
MKLPKKTEQLVDEILADTAPGGFAESVLRQMLRQARRRQRVRQLGQGLLVAAVLFALSLWLWWPQTPKLVRTVKEVSPAVGPRAFDLVTSQPLQADMIVNTQTGLVSIVTSVSPSTLALVSTRSADELFRELDDDEMLALLKDRPVALVRYRPHEATLVMPNNLLREGFQIE